MKTSPMRAVLALSIALACPAAWSAGWVALLRGTPAQDFNDEDLRQFLEAARSALDSPNPDEPVEWRNASTGSGARFVVLGTAMVENYSECKRMSSTSFSRRRTGHPTVWTACRDADGHWQIVSAR